MPAPGERQMRKSGGVLHRSALPCSFEAPSRIPTYGSCWSQYSISTCHTAATDAGWKSKDAVKGSVTPITEAPCPCAGTHTVFSLGRRRQSLRTAVAWMRSLISTLRAAVEAGRAACGYKRLRCCSKQQPIQQQVQQAARLPAAHIRGSAIGKLSHGHR